MAILFNNILFSKHLVSKIKSQHVTTEISELRAIFPIAIESDQIPFYDLVFNQVKIAVPNLDRVTNFSIHVLNSTPD